MAYCDWGKKDEINLKYHDEEWGVPLFDDQKQFEFLMMEAMQCGLSWSIVLHKREILRNCFDQFNVNAIASYHETDVERILSTEGMIHSQSKIEAVISNACCVQQIQKESGSFSSWLWSWTCGKVILYEGHEKGYIPASNALSSSISRDLKKRGFRYLGPVTIYSHLQACGIINDHSETCTRRKELMEQYPWEIRQPEGEKNVRKFL